MQLGNFVTLKTGKLDSNAAVPGGEYPFFTCATETYQIDKFAFDTECVLLAGNNANGVFSIKYYSGKFNAYQRTYIIEPKNRDELSTRFLYYSLQLKLRLLQGHSAGTATKYLTLPILNELQIDVPDFGIQNKITSILSSYDDLIENNNRRIALLEESMRLLYREWFVRLRFPGHEHVCVVNDLLEGWKRVPVPSSIEINPSTKLSDEDEHWYVEMADLSNNSMNIANPKKREGRSGSKFQNGDTLFARITPCLENGKTGFVNFMDDGQTGYGSTEFIVLRSKELTPEFVYLLARTDKFRENAIKSMVGASGRQRVKESCFNDFFILQPPSGILLQFSELADPVIKQIKNLDQQITKLSLARDLLLPRLMSGEIDV